MELEDWKVEINPYQIYPMGMSAVNGGIHFSVASQGDNCRLVLFEPGKEEVLTQIPFPAEGRQGDVWSMTVFGEGLSGLEYCYETDDGLMADAYGRSFKGREQWGDLEGTKRQLRTPILFHEFDWKEDRPPAIPYEDSIIYRIHTRGLTKHTSSKVKEKGTFGGIIQKIPYFKELGITTLELMPPVEFQEVMIPEYVDGNPYGKCEPTGRINYWGYGKSLYFAPKASYAYGKERDAVTQFKTLVKELHGAGMELVVEMHFRGDENPMMALDAVRFWVSEYHVDGIHLVGFAPVGLIGSDPYLSRTKLFATTWEGISGGREKHLAEYNDGFLVDMRRLLKGDEDQMNNLIFRSKRNPKDYGVINYIANTNGFTLMDAVSFDQKHNEANGENNQDGNAYNYTWNCGVEGMTRKKKIVELRKKQIRNALLLVFLSQGTPLLLAGDEFCNSKAGNNNSYCQDNEISWLNWNQLKTNQDMFEFTKNLIAFRKKHRVFHMGTELRIMDYMACGHPDISYHGVKAWCPEFENFRRQLGIMYCGEYARDAQGCADNYFFVAYNMHWEPHEFALPNLPKTMTWRIAVNTDAKEQNGFYAEGQEPVVEEQKHYMIPARTIVVFIGK